MYARHHRDAVERNSAPGCLWIGRSPRTRQPGQDLQGADFAKAHDKFVILGGAMGATLLNPDGVKSLATMPSLDELRAKLVGLIQAPATKIAQLSTAPAAKLARVFGAYANKDAA